MGVSMWIQSKLSPKPADPIQAKVLQIMPIAFSIFFFFFPAGLVIYSLCNNILSIAQQWQITRMFEKQAEEKSQEKEKTKVKDKRVKDNQLLLSSNGVNEDKTDEVQASPNSVDNQEDALPENNSNTIKPKGETNKSKGKVRGKRRGKRK